MYHVPVLELAGEDCIRDIFDYLKGLSKKAQTNKDSVSHYMLSEDNLDYGWSFAKKAKVGEIHEGVCGAHQ